MLELEEAVSKLILQSWKHEIVQNVLVVVKLSFTEILIGPTITPYAQNFVLDTVKSGKLPNPDFQVTLFVVTQLDVLYKLHLFILVCCNSINASQHFFTNVFRHSLQSSLLEFIRLQYQTVTPDSNDLEG